VRVYWLRRIPAETRIVVVLVFLALFQSLLLSVFGLMAIRHERAQVEQQIGAQAISFLRDSLVAPCENGLRERAERAFRGAFEFGDPNWAADDAQSSSGLFREAYRVTAEGRILSADGAPLVVPPELAAADDAEAARRASELTQRYLGGDIADEAAKAREDLEFARRHPFARDAFGSSLALLFAATPLLAGEGAPDSATLLSTRWIGVLNRVAGVVPAAEVERFLARVEGAAGADPAYAAGRDVQEERARALTALRLEAPRFDRGGAPRVLRRMGAGRDHAFYVRPFGREGELRVLSVRPAQLERFLVDVLAGAKAMARDGVTPHLEEAEAASALDPHQEVGALPGIVAVAKVSPTTVREQARDRERFYWYIILFSVAGILAGGFLAARVVSREVKLAKLKSGFVSNVTHELKTPLTSIRMFAEMLGGGKVTDEAERQECLDVIAQETERLGRLIQQVLDFGSLEAKRRQFRWTVGSLAPVLAREAERFRRATGIEEERLRVNVVPDLPPVTHDPAAFAEVLTNLLSNAYKYSPPDDRRILVTLGARQDRVVLAVEDNGPGVPRRERRRIFEQFYRGNDLLTREVEGTGLGLSIARSIVRAHGGRILVEDGSLGGSRFVVLLPIAGRRKERAKAPAETTR
jgi:signal transduction histidine kinase